MRLIFPVFRPKMRRILGTDSGMSTPDGFPLITLQPVCDFSNAWAALLLEGETPLDNAALVRVLHGFGLSEALGVLPCVAWVDPAAIDPALAAGLPRESVVLRFPVATAADAAQRQALDALHAAGFRLMASGFPSVGAELAPGITALAVACPGHAMPAGFGDWLNRLPGPHLALGTTEKVCPGFCRFHWLAGHLAGHASPTQKGDLTTRSLLLRLLALVAADADTGEIEALIKRDPNLSYHLLKLVNSVAISPTRQVTSFAQAIMLLGRRQLQRWLQLLLYARPQGSATTSPLLPRAALRAALMEALAKRLQLPRETQDHAFMTGMFSLLDLLFGEPLAGIIAPLNLPVAVGQALTAGSGQFGGLLAAVRAGEGAPSPALAEALAAAGVARDDWAAALVEAMRWAVQISREA